MDNVSIILSLCMGNMVAWLVAIYAKNGAYHLLWNALLGSLVAGLWAFAMVQLLPDFRATAALIGGPLCAFAAIWLAQKRLWPRVLPAPETPDGRRQ